MVIDIGIGGWSEDDMERGFRCRGIFATGRWCVRVGVFLLLPPANEPLNGPTLRLRARPTPPVRAAR